MRSGRLLSCCSFIVVFVTRSVLLGGVNGWTNISPPAGHVEQIEFDPANPQNVYSLLSGALYRSSDAGQTWNPVDSLSSPGRIITVAADPNRSGTLYAAPYSGGITKSLDYGLTWDFVGLSNEGVSLISVHPVKPWILFAASYRGLWRSTDRGSSWRLTGADFPDMQTLAFIPGSPSVIYAGSSQKSTDDGATWQTTGGLITSTAVHPQNPQILIGWHGSAIGKSTDGGNTWRFTQGPKASIYTVVFSRVNPDVLYAGTRYYDGLYRSTDAGETWNPSNAGLGNYDVQALAVQPGEAGSPERVLAGTWGSGFFASNDSGATWAPSNSGVRQSQVSGFSVSPKDGTLFVGVQAGGFFRSKDSGRTWQQINQGLPMIRVWGLQIDPHNPEVLFSVIDSNLYRSTNGGDNWEAQDQRLEQDLWVNSVVPDPAHTGHWFLTGSYLPSKGPAGNFVFSTSDYGETWQRSPKALPEAGDLVISPRGRLYLCSSSGIYASEEPLQGWQPLSPEQAVKLVFDPSKPDTILALSGEGAALRSTDAGVSWAKVELGDAFVSDLASDQTIPGKVFALGLTGLFSSADGGVTWRRTAKHPLPRKASAYDAAFISIDPSRPDFLYAGVSSLGGLFVLQHSASLYVPRLALGPKETTGLALSNRGVKDIALTVTAFDQEGRPIEGLAIINAVEVRLKPGEQKAMLATDLFGAGLASLEVKGWIRIDGVSADVTGFFSTLSGDLARLDTAPMSQVASRQWLISEVDANGTELWLPNPGIEPATATFELRDAQGRLKKRVNRTIPPTGVLSAPGSTLLGQDLDQTDTVWVESDNALVSVEYETDGKNYSKVLTSLDPDLEGEVLIAPQYAVGGDVRTTVTLINLDPRPGSILAQVYRDDGTLVGNEKQLTLSAWGKVRLDDPGFFGIDPAQEFSGYLKIFSPSVRVTGTVCFADPARERYAAVLPLVTTGARRLVFSHLVSTAEYFTGVAMLNSGLNDAAVATRVLGTDGSLVAETQFELKQGARRSSLLVDLWPQLAGKPLSGGIIEITSSEAIAAFALFGANDLHFLSAIAGQVLP